MEMAVRSMETAETAMETDGDGSGGTSPFQQGAGIETSVPQNSSTATTELRNSFWKSHKNVTKCNETQGKWCKNKHGASKIIDTFETYQ